MTPFDIFKRSFTVYRPGAGTFNASGLYAPASETSFSIKASLQPVTGEALQALPEGQRTLESYNLYTTATLNVANQPSPPADQVLVSGQRFEVQRQTGWANNIINHNVYLLQRVSA